MQYCAKCIMPNIRPEQVFDAEGVCDACRSVKRVGRNFVTLFSLFTFNRYTKEFILNDLLEGVGEDVRALVSEDLDKRLALDYLLREKDDEMNYNSIDAKFHNPFEVVDLFEREGFEQIKIHWYHYHAAPPMLESKMKTRLWDEAGNLEHTSTWRGYFLYSAFVVEAMFK